MSTEDISTYNFFDEGYRCGHTSGRKFAVSALSLLTFSVVVVAYDPHKGR
jgi:hypothetical protein